MRVYYVEPRSGQWRVRLSNDELANFLTKYEALDHASNLADTARPSIVYLLNDWGHLVSTWEFPLTQPGR